MLSSPPLLPHQQEKCWFRPDADGAHLPEYRKHWQRISPFEKNLYFWAEVQLQALVYQQDWNESAWLTLSYEDLFSARSQERLFDFLGMEPSRPSDRLIDKFRSVPQCDFSPEEIQEHPRVIEIANRLGYANLEIDKQGVLDRYSS